MAFTIPNEADAFHSDQAEPDKVDIDILVAGLAGNGVVSGCGVTAQGSPDMTVAVAAGTIRNTDGTIATVTSGNVTIGAADATNPRFDLITVGNTGTKASSAGTAAANPIFPAIPANSVVLAAVYVPATDTTIANNQIVDKRVILDATEVLSNVGASTAPAVTDDSGDGYAIGSRWFDTTNDKEYVCLDATVGAAVWKETTASGGGSFVGAKVYKTAQTVTDAILAFDNELWDEGGFHDNVTNNSRLTVPASQAGKYLAQASTWISGAARLEIFVNGTAAQGRGTSGAGSANYTGTEAVLNLAVGDYVQIKGNSGVSTTYGNAGNVGDHTVFSLTKL